MELGAIGGILKGSLMIISFIGAAALIVNYSKKNSLLRFDDDELIKIRNNMLTYCGHVLLFVFLMTFEFGFQLVTFLWNAFDGISVVLICTAAYLINFAYAVFIVLVLCRFSCFYPRALRLLRWTLVVTPIYAILFTFILFMLCNFTSNSKLELIFYLDFIYPHKVIAFSASSIALLMYSWLSPRIRVTWKTIDKKIPYKS